MRFHRFGKFCAWISINVLNCYQHWATSDMSPERLSLNVVWLSFENLDNALTGKQE